MACCVFKIIVNGIYKDIPDDEVAFVNTRMSIRESKWMQITKSIKLTQVAENHLSFATAFFQYF
jgi:hypothetical protein